MAVPQNPDVHMETVETAKNEETEPYKTRDTGILRTHGGEQPERVLEDIQYNNGQKSVIERKTDKQWLL